LNYGASQNPACQGRDRTRSGKRCLADRVLIAGPALSNPAAGWPTSVGAAVLDGASLGD